MKAQLPLSDPTFTLVLHEEFNSFDPLLWHNQYTWRGPVNNGLEYNSPANLNYTLNTGYLTIKCETVSPITFTLGDYSPYNYQSGVIQSKFTHKYGYFEISAKLPVGQGFWPAFWTLGGAPSTCTAGIYNEIDIMENNGDQSVSGTELGTHYHWRDINSCERTSASNIINGLANMANEHKYAVFWEPNRMTWFFDDVPVAIINDPTYTPQNACCTIINFAIDPDPGRMPDGTTVFPAYYQINYLKIWQLIPDCNANPTFCSNFNAGTYVSKVKQSISIGGSGCSDNINTSGNINFWATDFVLLDEGTTITDNGSGSFMAATTQCPY